MKEHITWTLAADGKRVHVVTTDVASARTSTFDAVKQ